MNCTWYTCLTRDFITEGSTCSIKGNNNDNKDEKLIAEEKVEKGNVSVVELYFLIYDKLKSRFTVPHFEFL